MKSTDFDFTKKIEDMTDEELKERIKKAYNYSMPIIRPMPYIGNAEEVINYDYPELTALCPMTGIQDLYTVKIGMVPDKSIPELKSLRFYFLEFRNLPISHEHLCSKIYEEFEHYIKPKTMWITLIVATRGGINTKIEIGVNKNGQCLQE